MGVTFGKRVVGEEAHAEAVKKAAGGAEVFGKRVLGSIPEPNVELIAKRNSEFGPRTTAFAKGSDTEGKDSVISVEEIENVLTENPTFFDSLYENELALPSGPRKAALQIFALVEQGIKGAGRKHVLDEISALLGNTHITNQLKGAHVEAQQEQLRAQEQRNEENKLLRDAPRVKALKERNENVEAVRAAAKRSESGKDDGLVSSDTQHQIDKIVGEKKIAEPTEEETRRALPDGVAAPAQGEGLSPDRKKVEKVQPESQARTKRAVGEGEGAGEGSGKGEGETSDSTRTRKPLTKKQKAARRKAAKARRAAAKK